MPLEHLVLADSPSALAEGLAGLRDLDPVGVDVERADWDRYWRAAALIQVGGGGRVVVVDPLSLNDLSALQAYLSQRTVVLHAMENDLAPLAAAGITPVAVEDTAVAAALLGLPTGLETLLETLIGVRLDGDKAAMQRADWEARPIPAEMLAYAAGDVADLPALWRALRARLDAGGRLSWYHEERDAVVAQPPVEERRSWTRTRGIGRMSPEARGRVQALWEARERLARANDTAPQRIMGDRAIVALAHAPNSPVGALGRLGVRRQAVRRYGEQLLAALAAGPAASGSSLARTRQVTDRDRATTDRLRALRSARAQALGLDPGVLCPSRTLLAALLSDPATPEELRAALGLLDWQWVQLGDAFCQELGLDGPGRPAPVEDRDHQETNAMADVLNPDALHHGLDQLPGWTGTVDDGIAKTYEFDDFAGSIAFVNRVAELAEEANHHPDIQVRWNKVTLTYLTHSAGGVTQDDLAQAGVVDTKATTA